MSVSDNGLNLVILPQCEVTQFTLQSRGRRNGLAPLLYLLQGSQLAGSFDCLIDEENLNSLKIKHLTDNHLDTEKYMPPIDMAQDSMLKDNKGNTFQRIALYSKPIGYKNTYVNMEEYKYMDEREWRYVPNGAQIIHDLEFTVSTNHRNYYYSVNENARKAIKEAKNYPNLKFELDDINHIIVGLDAELSVILEYK